MRDRTPQNPGRVRITPEDGTPAFYAVIEMADNATDAGTPLCKNTLLRDETAELLGIDTASNPTVNDAFYKLAINTGGDYPIAVTLKDYAGNPLKGVAISGIKLANGGTAITNDNGYVIGFATTTSVTLAVTSPFLDLLNLSQRVTATLGTLLRVTLTMEKNTVQYKMFESNANIKFGPNVANVDVCCVGGGGGGGAGASYPHPKGGEYNDYVYNGGGGGGGYVTNAFAVTVVPFTNYLVQIGSGGSAGTASGKSGVSGSSGGTGGTSSALGVSAAGGGTGRCGDNSGHGTGGAGNGRGGHYASNNSLVRNGAAGTVHEFDDAGRALFGGGGAVVSGSPGLPYGGKGVYYGNGYAGTGPGGGGSGGENNYGNGGAGYRGQVSIRWRNKS